MKCPKCKENIPDNSLKCPHCQSRTGHVCGKCSAVNAITDFVCKTCGTEFLKQCAQCKSINFATSEKCRKCGYELKLKPKPAIADNSALAQSSAKNLIVKGILSEDKKIISLSGTSGSGKTTVIRAVMEELQDAKYSWLYGKCTSLTQLTPGGLLQDLLINVFNLPNFCLTNVRFKKDASKFFKNEFSNFTQDEIFDLINFIYPSYEGTFETIFSNKVKTFSLLEKVFDKITGINKFVFVLNNFDFIDGFSYEFLHKYIQKSNVWNDLKLILIYNEQRPSMGYFYFKEALEDNVYMDIKLAPFEYKNLDMFVDSTIPEDIKSLIFEKSRGNAAYIENALNLYKDCKTIEQKFELPDTYGALIESRLAILSRTNPLAHRFLVGSSILGDKINLHLTQEIFAQDEHNFNETLTYLEERKFIQPLNEVFYEFKSTLLWDTILQKSRSDEDFENLNRQIFNFLLNFTLNSYAIAGLIMQNLKELRMGFDVWTKITKLSAYIGDANLYALSQKQCLALLNEFDDDSTIHIRYNISERLGKLLSAVNPQEALEYLPDAISNAQNTQNSVKEIELLSYLCSCCNAIGNYYGEVECVDNVLEKLEPEQSLQGALLKTTKLRALLNIGSFGEVINMIDNDIMPVFDEFFTKNQNSPSMPFVYDTWLKTYLILANALVLQGNDRSFEILTILFDIIDRYNIDDELFTCKCKIILAFANTMKGNIEDSEKILEDILKQYRENCMDSEATLKWNLVNIINSFIKKEYTGIQEELFEVVAFANNCGDNFTKNILKTLLGKVFKDNGQTQRALEIYNDQITYFAKEKMATGALLTWYLIADATLGTDGPESAAEIASQALEVAQNPKINNYFFSVLLRMIIAQASLAKSDFETAKNNLEAAIKIAREFNMNDLLSRLYLIYGQYFQELGLIKSPQQISYLDDAKQLYTKAEEIVQQTKNNSVLQKIKKAQEALKSFCDINNLRLSY